MKTYGGMVVQIHEFFTSEQVGGEWLASRPGRFTHGESAPVNHWIGGWVGTRAGVNDVENRQIFPQLGLELRPLEIHL
jgi:hypothetical protein